MSTLNCPSCGGNITGVSALIRSIDCSYCGSWLRLNNQLWEQNEGQQVSLDAPSFLRVGQHGSSKNGESFTIMGRIRLQYDQDSWDEWWVEDNYGKGFWLEEDDGTYYRHSNQHEVRIDSQNAAIGENLSLSNGLTLFITESFTATIEGREGYLPTEPETDAVVTYLDGVANGIEYSLEVENDQALLSQSEVFDIHAIQWEKT